MAVLIADKAMDMYFDSPLNISRMLRRQAANNPDHVFCRWDAGSLSYRQLDCAVDTLAFLFDKQGLGRGDRVMTMLGHHPDHIITMLALMRLGAIVVPVNTALRGASLNYLYRHCEPKAIVADAVFSVQLIPELDDAASVLWRNTVPEAEGASSRSICVTYPSLARTSSTPWPDDGADADDTVIICYTSGTTGPPKGVLVTDRMCRCAAQSSALLSRMNAGDTALFWDPLYHFFGIEVVILALAKPITLAMVERFSARKFWQWATALNATHIHYVGGVIQLLLKQPPSDGDRAHSVRIAWGGGCPADLWDTFEKRFGIKVHDSFGMTETSALNIINTEGVPGSVGIPLPYFDARLVTECGAEAEPGQVGELLIRDRVPGLITPGYFRDIAASAALKQDGWLRTGDLLKRDSTGHFYFFNRIKDSVRRRGENISAWEVERVINQHPAVVESALVGVRNEFGDEDLKIFVQKTPESALLPEELAAWCAERLPRFQIPRFIAFIDAFPRTPTQRIQKFALSRAVDNCWDSEESTTSLKDITCHPTTS